jgi:hypothetical protein
MNERSASTLPSTRRARLGLVGLLLAASLGTAGDAASQSPTFSPFQGSIAPGVQIFREDVPIWGLRINLFYGVQQTVFGLDTGLMNNVSENLSGIGVGFVNRADKEATGLQAAATNAVSGRFRGLQVAVANMNGGDLEGAQFGALNVAEEGFGLQVGLCNSASSMKGVQLGLININKNGFLPFFPGINIGW